MEINHQHALFIPPLVPAGEARARDDAGFTQACLDLFKRTYPVNKATIGRPVVTENAQWGPVLRADFTLDGKTAPGFLNRYICWKDKSGQLGVAFAIGQQVSPLDGAN